MDAVLFLGAAALLAWAARWWGPLALMAVPVAVLAGTTLPDLDMALGLGHRSGVTHSLLLPILLAPRPRWWAVAAGLALGVGLHLSADCFPNGMRGFATVKLPGMGSIGAWWSYAWLGANALACLGGGAWLLARKASGTATLAVLGAVAVVGVGYLWVTDGGWPALLVFTGAGGAGGRGRDAAPPGRLVDWRDSDRPSSRHRSEWRAMRNDPASKVSQLMHAAPTLRRERST